MNDLPEVRCQLKFPSGLSSVIYDNVQDAEDEAKAYEMATADHLGCSLEDLKEKVLLQYYFTGKPDAHKHLAWNGYKFAGQKVVKV